MSKGCSRRSTTSPTAQALACERAFLAALDGSCRTPIAGHAKVKGDQLAFSGLILSPDGQKSHAVTSEGHAADAAEIGHSAGEKVRRDAGDHFFGDWRLGDMPGAPPRVLVTRPEPGATMTARKLELMGFRPVKLPLQEIRPLAVPRGAVPEGIAAVAVTSANAIRHAPT